MHGEKKWSQKREDIGGSENAGRNPDQALGWTLTKMHRLPDLYKERCANCLFTHRVKMYCTAAAKRMEVICKTHDLPLLRVGLIHLFAKNLFKSAGS